MIRSSLALVALATLTGACGSSRAIGDDGAVKDHLAVATDTSRSDSTLPLDATTITSDVGGAARCAPPLRWAFVTDLQLPADRRVTEITGAVRYMGPVTEPLASSPAFDRELQVEVGLAREPQIVIQYFLPEGSELPVVVGQTYTFKVVNVLLWEGPAQALIITQPGRAPWDVIFVGEPGLTGSALTLHDELLSPVYIERVAGAACSDATIFCGTDAHVDALRFVFTTGAGISAQEVAPGASATLQVFGQPYRVTTLGAYTVTTPCPDEPNEVASYLIIAE